MVRTRVYEHTLPTSCGMNSNDGMNSLDFLSPNMRTSCTGTLGLSSGTMHSAQLFQVFLEKRAQGAKARPNKNMN